MKISVFPSAPTHIARHTEQSAGPGQTEVVFTHEARKMCEEAAGKQKMSESEHKQGLDKRNTHPLHTPA